jgi:hypothetical protein
MPRIRGIVEGIPNPGARWRWVIITTPQPFWSREKSTSCALNRILGSSYCRESKHSSSVVQSVAGWLLNELLRLVEWLITNDKRGRVWITLPVHVSRWTDEEPGEISGRTGSILAENSKLGTRIRQEFHPLNRNIFFRPKLLLLWRRIVRRYTSMLLFVAKPGWFPGGHLDLSLRKRRPTRAVFHSRVINKCPSLCPILAQFSAVYPFCT